MWLSQICLPDQTVMKEKRVRHSSHKSHGLSEYLMRSPGTRFSLYTKPRPRQRPR